MWATFFVALFGLLSTGIWMGIALGLTGLIIMLFWGGGTALLGSVAWSSINNYALLAIPGYVFMGDIIVNSTLGKRLFGSVEPLMARLPGKLLNANVLLAAIFAAVLGSTAASCALIGSVSIPELRRRGYDEKLILGTVASAGMLALIIPPSMALVIYGVLSETSIAALFAAGTFPGLLMAALWMVYLVVMGKLKPQIAPATEVAQPWQPTLRSMLRLWPIAILMFIAVAPVYLGWCTATEGAGVGSLAAIIVAFLFGKLNWQGIKKSLVDTAEVTSFILFLLVGAMILATFVSQIGALRSVVNTVTHANLPPIAILYLIYLMYLILGCFFDGMSIKFVTLPFVVPVIAYFKFDPVWAGVLITLIIEIGLVTPPVGTNLFVTQGVAGPGTKFWDIVVGSVPFWAITLVVIVIVTALPQVALFLPHALKLW